MSDLAFARGQMAISLAFHIVFAALGVAMPLFMVIAEWRHFLRKDPIDLLLAKRWAKGTAILFAVGAVSGTVLSFELGLLWPRFMKSAGAIIGMPFSLEGFAFFTEAIFLGIYLYAWKRVSARAHLIAGIVVAVSGVASAFFVVLANAFMNSPSGFRVVDGKFVDIDPIRAMFSPGWSEEVIHVILASYLASAATVCAIHAFGWLRASTEFAQQFHRAALRVVAPILVVTALLQPLSGDQSARSVAARQPAKLAALEGQFKSEHGAPLRIFGWPIPAEHRTRFALEIPHGLSFLAYHDLDAEVRGLDAFPPEDQPDPRPVHIAFQLMVGCGGLLALVSLALIWFWLRRKPLSRPLLAALVLIGPLGFVALEAGWVVTEVGRQPWILYGIMRTRDAVTPTTGLGIPFTLFTLVYLFLAVVVTILLRAQVRAGDQADA